MAETHAKPGDRVFAVLSADDDVVHLLGFGVYVGDEVPPAPYGFISSLYKGAKTWEECDAIARNEDGMSNGAPRPRNPKLQLDDGRVVWGMQCWWGPEDRYASFRGSRREVAASIP